MMKLHSAIFCAFLLVASNASAIPLEYHIQMTVAARPGVPSHPVLTGAELHVRLSWDYSSLSPTEDQPGGSQSNIDWATGWPTTNTTMSVEVVGTPSSDGVYDAKQLDNFEYGVPWWFVRDNGKVYAGLPAMTFDFEGQNVWLMGIAAQYTNDGSATTIYPRPYENEAVSFVNELFIPPEFLVGPYAMDLSDISGYARVVPEPAGVMLSSFALAAYFAFLRRRK